MLVRLSVHIDVKLCLNFILFLLLAKIKGEGALALLAVPSYVHVYSPLQVRQQPFSYWGGGGGGEGAGGCDFHCARKKNFRTFLSPNIVFS